MSVAAVRPTVRGWDALLATLAGDAGRFAVIVEDKGRFEISTVQSRSALSLQAPLPLSLSH